MEILFVFSFLILSIYCIIFIVFLFGILTNNRFDSNYKEKQIPISVLIPFRNEEQNIEKLIKSFKNLEYNLDKVEFIFINDNSIDGSKVVLENSLKNSNLNYKILTLNNSETGKKQAIIKGVLNSKNDYIVTTDADTTRSKFWLYTYSNAFYNNADFVIAPVINNKSKSFFGNLHNIESLMLSGITIGSASLNIPILCSGANLGYTKSLFINMLPYKDNINIKSGDDLFFLDKLNNKKHKIISLKTTNSLVYTNSHKKYKDILKQAIRWSSKNKHLSKKTNLYFSLMVFAVNTLVYLHLFLLFRNNVYSGYFLAIKFCIDFAMLYTVSLKFNYKNTLSYSIIIYMLYPIHLIVILMSYFFIKREWKGRRI